MNFWSHRRLDNEPFRDLPSLRDIHLFRVIPQNTETGHQQLPDVLLYGLRTRIPYSTSITTAAVF